MAEFSEVVRQYIRMCRLSACDECVLRDMDGRSCSVLTHVNPEEFERRVMEWANTHPEPVYPTWAEWLIGVGVLERTRLAYGGCDITSKVLEPIPANIAEKLGIKPKGAT